jgi:hypothetical protein
MGKKRKKNKPHKWIRPAPDEVATFGPFSIIRYGRNVVLSNQSTPEEQRAFLARSAEANTKVHAELAAKIGELQDLIRNYDPVLLMHRATYVLLPLFMKYRSENEYSHEESLVLPGVEYLQYLIARTEPNTSGAEPTEAEWEALWGLTLEVLRLTHQYLFTRKTEATPPSEIDGLRFLLDSTRLGIRGQRYPLFLADHWRDSLLPYASEIKEVYGITIDDLLSGLSAIEEYAKRGVLGRYESVLTVTAELMQRLRERGWVVGPESSDAEIERVREALATDEFSQAHAEAQEKARLTFTAALFDITELTSLPKSLLTTLSGQPGESVFRDPFLTNNDDLSPLSNSPMHFKPFLHVGDRFYFFYHSGFEDRIAELIEEDLLGKRPGAATSMAKRQSDRVEEVAKQLLVRVLQPDFAFQRVYYPNPDRLGDLTELDLLLGVDDVLLLVEAKSGSMSAAGSRGAPRSLAKDLSDVIIAGQRQSERAERYIRSQEEVAFYEETGKRTVYKVQISRYRRVFRVVVTKEFLSWVGAKVAVLSVIDPALSRALPWHISLDDLRIVAELFAGRDLEFAHFLEQRLQASAEPILSQHDELDHMALYFKRNQYHELGVRGIDQMSFDTSFTKHIDVYFAKRYAGEDAYLPGQRVPRNIGRLIEALRVSRLRGRFEAAGTVLAMGQDGRDDLEGMLATLEDRRNTGREPSIHLPFSGDQTCFSVSSVSDEYLGEEMLRCAARMRLGSHARWIVMHLESRGEYRVKDIRIITPESFSEAEIAGGSAHLDEVVGRARAGQKIGRNERCPCGSGPKYKACHERR